MITFRQAKQIPKDLMPTALEHLSELGIRPNLIRQEDADQTSKVNSKAMVLEQFIQNENGYYQIRIRDKELYGYTQKLIKDIFRMRILDISKSDRTVTAETDHLGIVLDIIEVLGRKYNLSVVSI